MHFLDFFTIVERDRDILNPIGPEKLDQVAKVAGLQDGDRVLDLCCGKGAMLRQWASYNAISGFGIDLNPAFVYEAQRATGYVGLNNRLTFVEGDIRSFQPDPAGYDLVTCLGATFAFGGFEGTLKWIQSALKPGGTLAVGEIYLRGEVTPEERQREGFTDVQPLAALHGQVEAAGLELVGLVVSSSDDWDHYSSLMWNGVYRWAAEHPDHPDRAEVLAKIREGRRAYFRWQRNHLGWAILIARAAA